MAVKITSQGLRPEERECAGACTNCHTRCEWLASDGTHANAMDQRDDDSNAITCPTCGGRIVGSYSGNCRPDWQR